MKVLFVRSGNNGEDPITQNQAESLIGENLNVLFFDIIGKGINGYLSNIFKLRDVIKKQNPDIIHAHYSFSAYIAVLAFSKKPVVCSLMGSDVNATNLFQKTILRICIKYFWKATIVKSSKMKDVLKIKNVYVIPNGVDFSRFPIIDGAEAKHRLKWDISKQQILFPANPKRIEKNYELAEKIFLKIKEEYPEIELKTLVNVPHKETHLYYCAASMVLFTSLAEGSSNVIKEALVCNCPIVSAPVGDVEENLKNVTNSFIAFTFNDYIKYVREVLESKLRSNGRDCITHLDSTVIAKKVICIYNKVLNKS